MRLLKAVSRTTKVRMPLMLAVFIQLPWALALPLSHVGADLSTAVIHAQKPSIEVELREVLVIGDDESMPVEYLLGAPRFVATDSGGNIYIADVNSMDIKVYDATGNYLRVIGARGEGPGEFKDLTTAGVDAQDRLVVADHLNSRITRFSTTGTVISTHRIDRNVMLWPRFVKQLNPDRYIFLYKLPDLRLDGSQWSDADFLFHVYADDLENKVATFASFADTCPTDLFSRYTSEISPGFFDVTTSGDILYAPGFFSGKLYRYRMNHKGWVKDQEFNGHVESKKAVTPVEVVLSGVLDPEDYPQGAGFIHSVFGNAGGIVHNQSAGLFSLTNGNIAYFSILQRGDRRVLGVELFDAAGTSLGYSSLDDISIPSRPSPFPHVQVQWKDDADHFYLIDRSGEYPVVRVVALQFKSTK